MISDKELFDAHRKLRAIAEQIANIAQVDKWEAALTCLCYAKVGLALVAHIAGEDEERYRQGEATFLQDATGYARAIWRELANERKPT